MPQGKTDSERKERRKVSLPHHSLTHINPEFAKRFNSYSLSVTSAPIETRQQHKCSDQATISRPKSTSMRRIITRARGLEKYRITAKTTPHTFRISDGLEQLLALHGFQVYFDCCFPHVASRPWTVGVAGCPVLFGPAVPCSRRAPCIVC